MPAAKLNQPLTGSCCLENRHRDSRAVKSTFLRLGLLFSMTAFAAGCSPSSGAPSIEVRNPGIVVGQDAAAKQLNIAWPDVIGTTSFQVRIDDSASFRRPIVTQTVKGRSLSVDVLEKGLAPGVPLYISVQPGGFWTKFQMAQANWGDLLPQQNYLESAWEKTGRTWLSRYSGVSWVAAQRKWKMDNNWPYGARDVAPQAYFIEHAMRGAVQMALSTHDLELIDELSDFYLVYSQRFTTLGAMRRKKSPGVSTKLLDDQGSDVAKTLPWIETTKSQKRVRENTLANSQFFHPAARLIRVISTLPESERTPEMRSFVATYRPILVRDHLIRLLYEATWSQHGAKNLPKQLIGVWRTLSVSSATLDLSYQNMMSDRDLWMIATAAELLGANANDPGLVPLDTAAAGRLREIVRVGVQFFQKKKTFYPNTKNFQGRVVGSASYFNGDMDDHPTMAYAGYSGASFPTPAQKKPATGASWDISHFYRVPVFLRSLYDNRKATDVNFPQARDIQLVINQYLYRVFQGDLEKPLFTNFFDGGNGWLRVGYHGKDFGYPPSQFCGSGDKQRPCLTTGGIYGWSQIAFFSDDLAKLQQSFLKMATGKDPATVGFRDRYYFYNRQTFAFHDAKGRVQYPFLLFGVLSGMPERFQPAQEITVPIIGLPH